MLLLGDNGALDKFRGKSSVVLGTDFKVPLNLPDCMRGCLAAISTSYRAAQHAVLLRSLEA